MMRQRRAMTAFAAAWVGIGLGAHSALADDDSRVRPYEAQFALCIGIDDYANNPKLQFAARNVRRVSEVLKSKMGYDVKCLVNEAATASSVRKALRDICDYGKNDVVLIYFYGHGYTVERAISGQLGYLMTYDSPGADARVSEYQTSAIPISELIDAMNHCAAKHVVGVLDCCFSGLAAQNSASLFSLANEGSFLSDSETSIYSIPSRQVICAGQFDEKSWEYDLKGTSDPNFRSLRGPLLSHFFVQTLKQSARHDLSISLDTLFKEIFHDMRESIHKSPDPQVQRVQDQYPRHAKLLNSSGDMLFCPGGQYVVDAKQLPKLLQSPVAMGVETAHKDDWTKVIAADSKSAVGKSDTQLEDLFKKTQLDAAQGDPQAMAALSKMYALGLGTPQNQQLAALWAKEACNSGDPQGAKALGFVYENGFGVPRDPNTAAHLYGKPPPYGQANALRKPPETKREATQDLLRDTFRGPFGEFLAAAAKEPTVNNKFADLKEAFVALERDLNTSGTVDFKRASRAIDDLRESLDRLKQMKFANKDAQKQFLRLCEHFEGRIDRVAGAVTEKMISKRDSRDLRECRDVLVELEQAVAKAAGK